MSFRPRMKLLAACIGAALAQVGEAVRHSPTPPSASTPPSATPSTRPAARPCRARRWTMATTPCAARPTGQLYGLPPCAARRSSPRRKAAGNTSAASRSAASAAATATRRTPSSASTRIFTTGCLSRLLRSRGREARTRALHPGLRRRRRPRRPVLRAAVRTVTTAGSSGPSTTKRRTCFRPPSSRSTPTPAPAGPRSNNGTPGGTVPRLPPRSLALFEDPAEHRGRVWSARRAAPRLDLTLTDKWKTYASLTSEKRKGERPFGLQDARRRSDRADRLRHHRLGGRLQLYGQADGVQPARLGIAVQEQHRLPVFPRNGRWSAANAHRRERIACRSTTRPTRWRPTTRPTT